MKDPDPQQVEMTCVTSAVSCGRSEFCLPLWRRRRSKSAIRVMRYSGAQNSLPVSAPLTPDGAMSVVVAGLQSRVSRAARGGLITSE
jgi:hypothetical protein